MEILSLMLKECKNAFNTPIKVVMLKIIWLKGN